MPVVPSLRLEGEALGARLPPLLVAAERVAANVALGFHGRRRVGTGDAFWQFRPYLAGDPVTRIDWRQSGKSTRTYLRETEWEATQSVWLWPDRSASMDWASGPGLPTKKDRAALLLVALATLLVRGGERVAALVPGERPGTGRPALERLVRAIEGSGDDVPAALMPGRDSTLVMISDFLAPLDHWRERLQALAAKRLHGHLVEILDPAEEDLPFQGRVRFEGLEREGQLVVGRAEALRSAYAERLAAHRAGLAELTRAQGWSLGAHRTDRPPQEALLALYQRMTDGPAEAMA